jgi:transglutaminase-like putative cysteine protease
MGTGGEDSDWLELFQLTGEVPPPPVELLDWPDCPPALPVRLYRLPPEREPLLVDRLPARRTTAWETACELLAWVRQRWEHANDHVERYDAVEILERAEAGERFACDEYTVVLCQALNAVGIPARWLGLLRGDHHAGVAAAHSVAEAWIDEWRRWVVLDGQNGAYWVADGDEPVGIVELQRAFRSGGPRSRFVGVREAPEDEAFWSLYFATAQTTGQAQPPAADLSWGPNGFRPVFQQRLLLGTDRLLRDAAPAYPDLASAWTGVAGTADCPVLTFGTEHPYVRGFTVTDERGRTALDAVQPRWPLVMRTGEHQADVRIVTDFAEISVGQVRYGIA